MKVTDERYAQTGTIMTTANPQVTAVCEHLFALFFDARERNNNYYGAECRSAFDEERRTCITADETYVAELKAADAELGEAGRSALARFEESRRAERSAKTTADRHLNERVRQLQEDYSKTCAQDSADTHRHQYLSYNLPFKTGPMFEHNAMVRTLGYRRNPLSETIRQDGIAQARQEHADAYKNIAAASEAARQLFESEMSAIPEATRAAAKNMREVAQAKRKTAIKAAQTVCIERRQNAETARREKEAQCMAALAEIASTLEKFCSAVV